jgi:hypothetical protein
MKPLHMPRSSVSPITVSGRCRPPCGPGGGTQAEGHGDGREAECEQRHKSSPFGAAVVGAAAIRVALDRIALGQIALGQIALGQIALGQIALGQIALGQIALGQIALGGWLHCLPYAFLRMVWGIGLCCAG